MISLAISDDLAKIRTNRNIDLILIIVATIITALVVLVAPCLTIIRAILGFLLVLFFPGYVLVESLFPKKEELDFLERFALGIGLSVAISVFTGLGLNFTPWGIKLKPVLLSLCSFTLTFCGIAALRRCKLSKM